MYELDFLPVESEDGGGTKSGDAIAGRFWLPDGSPRTLVVDAGYSAIGEDIVDHIRSFYGTERVDLVVSTHPDADHLNGLLHVLEDMDVGELLVHQPRNHLAPDEVKFFSNIEKVDAVIKAAVSRGVTVTEPFVGLTRWDGLFRILGPSIGYYETLIAQHVTAERTGTADKIRAAKALTAALAKGSDLLHRVLDYLPIETLEENPETSSRNNTSTVIFVSDAQNRILLTGDAGVPALSRAADEYERLIGSFRTTSLDVLQVPHHGSRHNMSPSLLDRVVGPKGSASNVQAIISSAKASSKHPSPKVTNALLRRGAHVVATEGRTICSQEGLSRAGWTPAPCVEPLDEVG